MKRAAPASDPTPAPAPDPASLAFAAVWCRPPGRARWEALYTVTAAQLRMNLVCSRPLALLPGVGQALMRAAEGEELMKDAEGKADEFRRMFREPWSAAHGSEVEVVYLDTEPASWPGPPPGETARRHLNKKARLHADESHERHEQREHRERRV